VVWAPEGEEFTLASRAKSKFYIDFSKVIMTPDGAAAIVGAVVAALPSDFDAIGGPMSGADPIVGAVLPALHCYPAAGRNVRGFVIRKEPKGRGPGAGEMYEGYLEKHSEVVLVEDVTTSGGSVLKAIKVVEEQGASVIKVITLLDRLAGAAEKLKDYNFQALTTLDDLKIGV
jgi:orotate phosphoribosyltransferase